MSIPASSVALQRRLQEQAMPFLARVAVPITVRNAEGGGATRLWQVILASIPCRVSPIGATAQERERAGAIGRDAQWSLTMPAGTYIEDAAIIGVSGETDGSTWERWYSITGGAMAPRAIETMAKYVCAEAATPALFVPSSVTVTPAIGVGERGGPLVPFAAEVRDASNNIVVGARVAWSIPEAGLAVIDTTGNARALARGVATVRATVGGVTGVASFRSGVIPALPSGADICWFVDPLMSKPEEQTVIALRPVGAHGWRGWNPAGVDTLDPAGPTPSKPYFDMLPRPSARGIWQPVQWGLMMNSPTGFTVIQDLLCGQDVFDDVSPTVYYAWSSVNAEESESRHGGGISAGGGLIMIVDTCEIGHDRNITEGTIIIGLNYTPQTAPRWTPGRHRFYFRYDASKAPADRCDLFIDGVKQGNENRSAIPTAGFAAPQCFEQLCLPRSPIYIGGYNFPPDYDVLKPAKLDPPTGIGRTFGVDEPLSDAEIAALDAILAPAWSGGV